MKQFPPYLRLPEDPNAKVWRYMDFTKYVSLLHTQAIYFSRTDKQGDHLEGSFSKKTIDERKEIYRLLSANPDWKGPGAGTEADFLNYFTALHKDYPKLTFISCWHMNIVESDGMWQLYAKSGTGVAIATTFAKLNAMLPDDVFGGVLNYVDYREFPIPNGNTFFPFMFKRSSFKHEQEVRLLIQHNRTPLDQPVQDDVGVGIPVPVRLNDLIDTVYISPRAPVWYVDLVKSVSTKYGFNKEVKQSELDSEAVY